MEFENLIEIIEDAGYDSRSYVGRGMNRECLGIVTNDSMPSVICNIIYFATKYEFLKNNAIKNVQYLTEELQEALQDSMGKQKIIYFPNIKWEEIDLE